MWKKLIVLIDFGSTFTKAAAVSRQERKVICSVKFLSTVSVDAKIGLVQCLDAIAGIIGKPALDKAERYASSSAAGGLRMAVVGLTKTLSLSAGYPYHGLRAEK
ncbi:hypothetical protein FACS189468_9230 [Spirochaetia bacterium]|nr:hypothetical protein FACS189468_9230 [Spirochaetia bacterium]